MKKYRIGFAITGSFCTFKKALASMSALVADGHYVVPIFSYSVEMNTRFYQADEFRAEVIDICGNEPLDTIVKAEPIGPKLLFDLIVVAPCTGNTLAKINLAITDTPVVMATKAQLRNQRPVVIALSTNDGLTASAANIAGLINRRNVYFVPYMQDDCTNKTSSLVADFKLLPKTIYSALEGVQLQPVIKER